MPSDPLQVQVDSLRNGLTVYRTAGTEPGRFTAYAVVRVGSSHEPDDAGGLAHYLEHMMFKGTDRLGTVDGARDRALLHKMEGLYTELAKTQDPEKTKSILRSIDGINLEVAQTSIPGEVLGLYEGMGAQFVSASTGDEITAYFCNLPASRFRAWAKLEAERLSEPVFRLFFTELEVVQEERRRLADDGTHVRFDALLRLMFPTHTYGTHAPIGLRSDLERPRFDLLNKFHHRWYRPNNSALVIVGDLDDVDVHGILEEEFGSWESQEVGSTHRGMIAAQKSPRHRMIRCPGPASVAMAWPMGRLGLSQRVRLDVVARLLWDGQVGRLADALVGNFDARAPQIFAVHLTECSYLHVGLQLAPTDTHELIETQVLEQLNLLAEGTVPKGELQRALLGMEIEHQASLESGPQRALLLAESFALGESWDDALRRIELRRGTAAEDLSEISKAVFHQPYCVVQTQPGTALPVGALPPISPIPVEEGRQSARARELLGTIDRQPQPQAPVGGEDYEVLIGTRGPVVWTRNALSQLFRLRLLFDRGFVADPLQTFRLAAAQIPGAAEEGRSRGGAQVLGGAISHKCEALTSYVEVTGLAESLETLVETLRLRMMGRTWSKQELASLQGFVGGRYHRTNASATEIAKRAEDYLLHGGRPGNSWSMGAQSASPPVDADLDGLSRRGFATQFFGVINSNALSHLLPGGEAAQQWSTPQLGGHEPKGIQITIVDSPMESVELRVTFADRRGADPAAIDLHQAYLSNWSGLLSRELRERRGLVYHVGAEASHREYDPKLYRLSIWANTSPARVKETLSQVMKLACRRDLEGPEFGASRTALIERVRSTQPTARDLAAQAFSWHLSHGGHNPSLDRAERIKHISPQDAAAVAPVSGRATVVIVGNKAGMNLRALEKMGTLRIVTVDQVMGSSLEE